MHRRENARGRLDIEVGNGSGEIQAARFSYRKYSSAELDEKANELPGGPAARVWMLRLCPSVKLERYLLQ